MELLGESTVEESFTRVLMQLSHFQKNLGRVIVKYGEPISLKEHIQLQCNKKQMDLKVFLGDDKAQTFFVSSFGKDVC